MHKKMLAILLSTFLCTSVYGVQMVDPKSSEGDFKRVDTFIGHTSSVRAVCVSGSCVISGSQDSTLKKWDLETRSVVHSYDNHLGSICSVACSPNGSQVASSSLDKTVRILNLKTNSLTKGLESNRKWCTSVAWGPRQYLALTALENKIRIWNLDTDEIFQLKSALVEGVFQAVVFSPDGGRLVSGCFFPEFWTWDFLRCKPICEMKGHSEGVLSVAFSPDGKQIISGSSDTTSKIWDCRNGETVKEFEGHKDSVLSVAFSPDGKQVVSASGDSSIIVWDLRTTIPLQILDDARGPVNSVVFSPDGKKIISASDDHLIRMWKKSRCAC